MRRSIYIDFLYFCLIAGKHPIVSFDVSLWPGLFLNSGHVRLNAGMLIGHHVKRVRLASLARDMCYQLVERIPVLASSTVHKVSVIPPVSCFNQALSVYGLLLFSRYSMG